MVVVLVGATAPRVPTLRKRRRGHDSVVETAIGVGLALVSLLTLLAVGALFVWAARKDGEADRALQARLGIRRRTRLGR